MSTNDETRYLVLTNKTYLVNRLNWVNYDLIIFCPSNLISFYQEHSRKVQYCTYCIFFRHYWTSTKHYLFVKIYLFMYSRRLVNLLVFRKILDPTALVFIFFSFRRLNNFLLFYQEIFSETEVVFDPFFRNGLVVRRRYRVTNWSSADETFSISFTFVHFVYAFKT